MGCLLLAEPFSDDYNFRRSVVLLCEHDKEGTFGLILNKVLQLSLSDALPELEAADIPLYYGGPVQTDTLHYLHTFGDVLEGSVEVNAGLFWGGDFEKMKFLINTKQANSGNVRFFLGYSGWTFGQLEEEIRQNSWILTSNDKEFVFDEDSDRLWRTVLHRMGGDYRLMSNFPDDPQLN